MMLSFRPHADDRVESQDHVDIDPIGGQGQAKPKDQRYARPNSRPCCAPRRRGVGHGQSWSAQLPNIPPQVAV
jgi:hypothetical protein